MHSWTVPELNSNLISGSPSLPGRSRKPTAPKTVFFWCFPFLSLSFSLFTKGLLEKNRYIWCIQLSWFQPIRLRYNRLSYRDGVLFPTYLCRSICLFVPSSFCCCCFDVLVLTVSADASAALFLPLPAPPPAGATVPSFSAAAEAAAALEGRPRRLTGDASVPASGVAFWLGTSWKDAEENLSKENDGWSL